MKILIVDDIAANRVVIKNSFLTIPNMEIAEADNGLTAVELAKSTRFDIIFMDIMMPILDGVGAVEQIREFDHDAVIVAVSALDDADTIAKMLHAGAEDYLIKPVNMRVMRARLRNYFNIAKYRKFSMLCKNDINLYDAEVYSRITMFKIESETALMEFWEYFLDVREQVSIDLQLCSAVQTLFDIASIILYIGNKPNIYLEFSDSHSYLTMCGIECTNSQIIKEHIEFNFGAYHSKCNYKLSNSKISIKVDKFLNISEVDGFSDELCEEDFFDSSMINDFLKPTKAKQSKSIKKEELEDILYYLNSTKQNGYSDISEILDSVSFILSHNFSTFYLSIAVRSFALNLKNTTSMDFFSIEMLVAKLIEWVNASKNDENLKTIEEEITSIVRVECK